MPINLLKPGAKVKQFHTGDKPYSRETFNHNFNDLIRSCMADQIGVFKDKQRNDGSTSQASKDCKSLFSTA